MKIRLVISLAGPIHGGLQVLSLRLAQRLKKLGHDVRIIARFSKAGPTDYVQMEAPKTFTVEGVDIDIISIQGWKRLLLLPVPWLRRRKRTFFFAVAIYKTAFAKVVEQATPGADIVHFFGVGAEMLGYSAQNCAEEKGIPFVVEPAIHVGQSGHSAGDMPLYLKADMVIAHSEFEAKTLRENGVVSSHVYTVKHGFDALLPGDGDRFRNEHGIRGPIILFIGRRCEEKGYFLLLKAFTVLRETFPDVSLVIGGPGAPPPSTVEGVLELGYVSEEIKRDAMAACTVFCMPSHGESFGMAYFEAWSCVKPVIGLDLPVLRETIGVSDGGLLAVPNDLEDLVGKLRQILTQPKLANEMGTHGQEFSRGYSWEQATQDCLQAYARAQENRRKAT